MEEVVEIASVGFATLQIIPSTRGIKGQLDKEFGGLGSSAGSTFGNRFSGSFGSNVVGSMDKLGGQITSKLGSALKVGGLAAIGAVGASLVGGVSRLLNIEDAQAKLRGLGHDTKVVEQVMVNALAAVKGTAFGLDSAATAAAGAIASGVKPGQDLERTLRLIGDAATIGGTSFDEMGAIFNKVGAGNRVTMQEINQLSDRGIPIMQWLADQYGVTALEARKMVEQGEIDFAKFRTAIEENIGGAALESGNTTRGAFANMRAAASRFGAALAGPIFEQARNFFTGAIDWIDGLTEKVGPLANAIGEWLPVAFQKVGDTVGPILSNLGDAFQSMFEWMDRNSEEIGKIVKAVLPAAGALAGLAVSINVVSTALRLLALATPLGIILALATAFMYAYQNSEEFRDRINGALAAVRDFVGPIIEKVVGWIAGIGESTSDTGSWIGETWELIKATFKSATDAVMAIVGTFVKIAQDLWARFGTQILKHMETAWNSIRQVIDGVLKIIKGIFDVFAGVFTGDWRRVWEGIKSILSGVWDGIVGAVELAINTVSLIIGGAMAGISSAWSLVWNSMKTVLSNVWNGITDVVQGAINKVIGLINGITGGINVVLRFLGLPEIAKINEVGHTAARVQRSSGLQEFHTGGVVGRDGSRTSGRLRSDEQIIKALKGEEVLTEDDPRHIANIGIPDTDWVLPIGGPFDFVGKGLSAAGGFIGDLIGKFRELIANTARPIVNAALSGLDFLMSPYGRFGDMGAGLVRKVATGALDWLSGSDKAAEDQVGDVGEGAVGSGWRKLVGIFNASGLPGMVTSTVRSGGGTSRHNRGLAADFSIGGHFNRGYGSIGLRNIFNAFLPYAANLAELILAGAPFNIKNGKKVGGYAWGSPGSPGNHWNHVHAATFDSGGTLAPGWNTVLNATGAPETLRPVIPGDVELAEVLAVLEHIDSKLSRLPSDLRHSSRKVRG